MGISLKQIFVRLASDYSADSVLTEKLWDEIEKAYSSQNRFYHTLEHLENVYSQMDEVRSTVSDWNTMLFTLFYHDIIYNASKNDNEERSADVAEERMSSLGVPADFIDRCRLQILATRSHQKTNDTDMDLFTDADLSVLGMDWELYKIYFQQVRKEYKIYPDLLYNPGRKKVLKHFLEMDRIFKTEFFHQKFEGQARKNLIGEMKLL